MHMRRAGMLGCLTIILAVALTGCEGFHSNTTEESTNDTAWEAELNNTEATTESDLSDTDNKGDDDTSASSTNSKTSANSSTSNASTNASTTSTSTNTNSNTSTSTTSTSTSTSNSGTHTNTECEHDWVAVYRTVHHDAVTHEETTYTTETTTIHHDGCFTCRGCGATFTTSAAAAAHCDNGSDACYGGGYYGSDGWDETVTTQVPHTTTVVDQAAWDEQVIDHYECTKCGATK